MISLASFFKCNSEFIKNEYTYNGFYQEVINCKIPDTDIIAISLKDTFDLVKYFAVLNAGKIAILVDPEIFNSQLLEDIFFGQFKKHPSQTFSFFKDKKLVSYSPVAIDECLGSTILFTSGSSGAPKAIELSLKSILSSAKDTIKHYNITSKDNWALSLPLFHIGGIMIVFRTILNEATTTPLSPKNLGQDLSAHDEITIISVVDLQLQKILQDDMHIERARKLKVIVIGGARSNEATLFKACKNGLNLSHTYGMSETCSMICATSITRDLSILKSSGQPLGQNKITIIDNKIQVSSSSLALGVWNSTRFGPTLLTNDLGHFSANTLFVEGRSDDIFISGGKNISPSIIDQTIKANFLEIEFSKTIGIEDKRFGRVAVTLIQSSKLIDHLEFKSKLKNFLPSYLIPKMFIQTKDIETIYSGIKLNAQNISKTFAQYYKCNDLLKNPLIRGNLNAHPLFIFHGFMGSYKDFLFLCPLLEEHYLLIFVNLPGHHNSALEDKVKFENFEDYCDELESSFSTLKKYSLLGYSLGGRVCSVLSSMSKTDKINNLILESSGLGIEKQSERDNRRLSDVKLFDNIKNQEDLDVFIEKWYDQKLFEGIKNFEDYNILKNKNIHDVAGWKYSLEIHGQASMPRLDPETIASKRKCYYIYGAKDLKYQVVADKLNPFSKVYAIKDAPHNPHITHKSEYLEVIESILIK